MAQQIKKNNRPSDYVIEDAQLAFRNFAGRPDAFNKAGDRNFAILLRPEDADRLSAEGWNVKLLRPRSDEDEPQPYIQVNAKFGQYPPKCYLITDRRVQLDESNVDVLDYSDIQTCDVVLNPYQWEVNGKAGIKAYLRTIYATIAKNSIDAKYLGIPTEEATPIE